MLKEEIGEKSIESRDTSRSLETKEVSAFRTEVDFRRSDFDIHWIDNEATCHDRGCDVEKPETGASTDDSPGTWDPGTFEEQAPSSWSEYRRPKRIQDIGSPLLVELEADQLRSNSDDDEWPFKSPCKMEEKKKKKKMTPKTDCAASDIDSEGENPPTTSNGEKVGPGDVDCSMPSAASRTISEDDDEAMDNSSSSKKKKGSSHSSKSLKDKDSSRRAKKKDHEPTLPRRGRVGRSAADEEDADEAPIQPEKGGRSSMTETEEEEKGDIDSSDKAKKPKRRGTKSEIIGDDDEGLGKGSFHKLAKDFDKKPLRSSSKGRKTRAPGSAGGSGGSTSRRRRIKERLMDYSGHSTSTFDDDTTGTTDEFGEEEHEIKLKGDDGTPGSGRKTWRDRRAQNLQAPGSGGRRPPTSRRAQMRRSSSERWMRAVEGVDAENFEEEGGDVNRELSRSAHVVRRYHSGGVGRMATGLGSSSFHGVEGGRTRTPNRRPPRKAVPTPNSDGSEGGSFGADDYEYDLNLSGRSSRTLDSIEDLEDFEHMDFKTPGMMDYDEEILELMQKANPEHTTQLQRRVGRKREAVNYDQNMPMMTKQALMTRTASSQVQRQYVDQSSIDRRRLLVRSMSNSSMASNDELSMSQHRQQFARVARRPPPRTRSSGMAALSRSEHPYHGARGGGGGTESEDRRRVFRTKSGASTSSFRQNQKPNRVQSVTSRDRGLEGARKGPPEERKGNLSRAQSMHAAVGRKASGMSPKKPERRVPAAIDTKASKAREKSEEDDDSSVSEDSDLESDEDNGLTSPRRKIPIKVVPKVALSLPKKKTDKRDFSVRRNRCKLHSMLYDLKMGVDMKDLLNTVQQGEITRSPIKTLMMPSP